MSAQSLFSKKNIKAQRPDTSRGIMEELNLPPEVIAFVRENSRNLQIGLIVAVVLVLGWVFYDYYTAMQAKKGASLLASAMQVEATGEKAGILESVISEYSRTDAALWARIELAHIDFREERFAEAAGRYEAIIKKLSKDDPVLPLVRMNLAESYVEAGQYDQAIAQYNILKKIVGFKEAGYFALARIYRAKDDPAMARKEYEEFLADLDEGADPQLRSRVQAMLLSLGGEEPPAAQQPAENQ